jgi:hypothetical protein
MNDSRTLAPLEPTSRLLVIYWWLLCLGPPLNLLFALEPTLRGRPPEEALGGFITVPLLIAMLLMAPVVAVRALASPLLSRSKKVLCVVLSLSAFPMFLLVEAIWSLLGSHERAPSRPVELTLAAASLVWVVLAWWARAGLRRDTGASGA